MVYLDASFVVALHVNERHSDEADRWMEQHTKAELVSADWCTTEVASALAIKVRTDQITQGMADAVWQRFEEFCGNFLQMQTLQSQDFATAAQLCRIPHTALRAGDSLHLAVAQRLQCKQLLSFDKNLNLNARAAGLNVLTV